jgi:hypothetical protein
MNRASAVQGQHSPTSLTLDDGSQTKEPGFGSEAGHVADWFRRVTMGAGGVRSGQEGREEEYTTSKPVHSGDEKGHDATSTENHECAEEGSEVHHADAYDRCSGEEKQAFVERIEGWWLLEWSKDSNTHEGVVTKDNNGTALLFTAVQDGSGDEFVVRHFSGRRVLNPQTVEIVMDKHAKIAGKGKLAMTWNQYKDPDVIFTLVTDGPGFDGIHLKEQTDIKYGEERKRRESYWVWRGKAEHKDGENVLREYYNRFHPSKHFDTLKDDADAGSTTAVVGAVSTGSSARHQRQEEHEALTNASENGVGGRGLEDYVCGLESNRLESTSLKGTGCR